MKNTHATPLICSEPAQDSSLLCRASVPLSPIEAATMMYMPAGVHTISVYCRECGLVLNSLTLKQL